MSERLTEIVQIRAPARLTEALAREARRQMIPKSVLVRLALAERLGLLEQGGEGQQARREQQASSEPAGG